MINAFLKGMFNFVGNITTVILLPITTAISNVLGPSVNEFFQPVSNLFNYLEQFVPLSVSYLGLTSETFAILLTLFVATITIPIAVHGFKLALKWYNSLKL